MYADTFYDMVRYNVAVQLIPSTAVDDTFHSDQQSIAFRAVQSGQPESSILVV